MQQEEIKQKKKKAPEKAKAAVASERVNTITKTYRRVKEPTGLEYEPPVTPRQERRWSKLLPGMENEPRVTPRQIRKWGKK
jgi:hypothetical protein